MDTTNQWLQKLAWLVLIKIQEPSNTGNYTILKQNLKEFFCITLLLLVIHCIYVHAVFLLEWILLFKLHYHCSIVLLLLNNSIAYIYVVTKHLLTA